MRFAVSLLLLLASSHCCCALRVDPVGRRAILAGAAAASFIQPAHAEETEEERKARVKARLEAKMAKAGVKAEIDTSNVKVLDIIPDASNSRRSQRCDRTVQERAVLLSALVHRHRQRQEGQRQVDADRVEHVEKFVLSKLYTNVHSPPSSSGLSRPPCSRAAAPTSRVKSASFRTATRM